ncbi:DUF2927 domain-containing protein [Pseudooceanicola sp.]|uniref:DUF2927 domain-containing protein n=1 Tax=Pseudooceanicola sp. TaxID=1914328 RepID=UPI002639612B|nr:DUF2927 domain-containing protein [Pseudooceanicola sp.]MDF1855271.1 DUF2927 domain-containing protein [Pseudooceanicola sp.]
MRGTQTLAAALMALTLLTACEDGSDGYGVSPPRRAVPATIAASPRPESAASTDLRRYYAQVQADLLAQGLLRQEGGGIDTPFSAEMLAQNFERIALYDEYARGGGLQTSNAPSHLRRWVVPVRVAVEFGATVPVAQRNFDRNEVVSYTARLARLTGHPLTYTPGPGANFHVLVMGEDDRAAAIARIRQLVPNISDSSLGIFRDLPRSIHCLVVAFSGSSADYEYRRAIAFVRAEHPDLMRRSCFHEEMAQGLGLANDSPSARPSIFNDDDEFALLTSHDEMLLRMLYDPRLRPGMTPDTARPIIQSLANTLVGGPS